jgi:hypothetical protein
VNYIDNYLPRKAVKRIDGRGDMARGLDEVKRD